MLSDIDNDNKIMPMKLNYSHKLLLIGVLNMANSPQLKTEHN